LTTTASRAIWVFLLASQGSIAIVTGVAIEFSTSKLQDLADADAVRTHVREGFARDFQHWVGRVAILLELWSRPSVDPLFAARLEGRIIQVFDHQTDSSYEAGNSDADPLAGSRAGVEPRILSIADWRSAARLISAGKDPDVAWSMFNRARKLADAEPRFAVIKACAAVEVAVGRRVAETLYGHPEEARDLVLEKAGGLVGLVQLADKMYERKSKSKRPDYSNALARLRNQVAHAGMNQTRRKSIWLLPRRVECSTSSCGCLCPNRNRS